MATGLHAKQPTNGLAEQLAYLLAGMTDEHRDAVMEYANLLYIKDNPHDRLANPFAHIGKPKKEEQKS